MPYIAGNAELVRNWLRTAGIDPSHAEKVIIEIHPNARDNRDVVRFYVEGCVDARALETEAPFQVLGAEVKPTVEVKLGGISMVDSADAEFIVERAARMILESLEQATRSGITT